MDSTIIIAGIGAAGIVASATIPSLFSYRASCSIRDHVTGEGESITRIEGKIDDILGWQGRHEAAHRREAAANHR